MGGKMESKNSEEKKDFFTTEMSKIYKLVIDDPIYQELSDDKLKERIAQMQEQRMKYAKAEDAKVEAYYSSLSFRTKKNLVDTIFESIRGL